MRTKRRTILIGPANDGILLFQPFMYVSSIVPLEIVDLTRLHYQFVGTTFALQMTTFLNTILVIGPVGPPPTAQIVDQILHFGNVVGAELPPSLIEDMCRDDTMLKRLQDLKYLYYAGAPLNKATGDRLAGRCFLHPGIGSTEAGGYFTKVRDDDDWNYYTFRAAMGVHFEHWSNDLYELVFYRDGSLKRWQQVFYLYPNLDRFHTKDLWTKHPTKEGLWAYAGRTDDLIILSHGESLQAAKIEAEITNHPDIQAVVVGGEGRLHPCLIIELAGSVDLSPAEQVKVLDGLWPEISKANRLCSEYVKLQKDLMVCATATKPLVRTIKNTVLRRESLALYQAEIDALYAHSRPK